MPRRFAVRGTLTFCMLVDVAARSVKRDFTAGTRLGHSDRAAEPPAAAVSKGTKLAGMSAAPTPLSRAYEYCDIDAEGRPMVFNRRRLRFFLPESPPEMNDRTFIETNECH